MAVSGVGANKRKNIGLGSGLSTDSSRNASGSVISSTNKNISVDEVSFQDTLVQETSIAGGEAVDLMLPNGELSEAVLTALQDKIHQTGDLLLSKPGYDTVIEYKNAVQTLLKSILPHLHEKEELKARGKHAGIVKERKFTFIHQVNQKLDNILKLVVNAQADQMRILKELDEIRGLLINILQ